MTLTHSSTRQGELLISLDTEIDRTFSRRLRRQRNIMNEAENGVINRGNDQQDPPLIAPPENQNRPNAQRTMREFVYPHIQGDQNPIVRPAVATNNFEIKLATIQNS